MSDASPESAAPQPTPSAPASSATQSPPPPPPPPQKSRWGRIGYIAAGVAIAIVGGRELLDQLTLPTCSRPGVDTTLRQILAGRDVTVTVLDDFRELENTSARKLCSAHIETADETGTIEYSITWDGWSPYIKIEKAEVAQRPNAPAADRRTGSPPNAGSLGSAGAGTQ